MTELSPTKSRAAGGERCRVTRRDFSKLCIAAGSASVVSAAGSTAGLTPSVHFMAIRFESRRELELAAASLRARFPGSVLLDAIVAPHVPELLVIHDGRNPDLLPDFVYPLYEVRRFSEEQFLRGQETARGSGDPPRKGPTRLEIPSNGGSVWFLGFESLAERAADWDSAAVTESGSVPAEVGFYRILAG